MARFQALPLKNDLWQGQKIVPIYTSSTIIRSGMPLFFLPFRSHSHFISLFPYMELHQEVTQGILRSFTMLTAVVDAMGGGGVEWRVGVLEAYSECP